MDKIFLIGANEELKKRLEREPSGRQSRMKVTRRDWHSVKGHPGALSEADILALDLMDPDAYTVRGLTNLQSAYPRLPLVVITDADLSRSCALTRLLDKPTVDFVRPSADAEEVRQRIRRLLRRRAEQLVSPQAESGPLARRLAPELHTPRSGRLDARRIADFFGMTLKDVARALGASYARLHKTPDAASAQEGLFVFERIAAALLTLTGSQEAARIWLHLPEDQLSGKTPAAVILRGDGCIVAEMLDDMLIGQPS